MASLFAQQLKRLGACSKAIEWVENKEFGEAWASCEDSYWLFWLAEKLGVNLKLFIQIACRCTRLVLHLVPKGEERPRKAIEAVEGWLEGKVSVEEVKSILDVMRNYCSIVEDKLANTAKKLTTTEAETWINMAISATAQATTLVAILTFIEASVADHTARVIRAVMNAAWAASFVFTDSNYNNTRLQILSIIREVMTEPVREKLAALKV